MYGQAFVRDERVLPNHAGDQRSVRDRPEPPAPSASAFLLIPTSSSSDRTAPHSTDPGHQDPHVHRRDTNIRFCSDKARNSTVFCRRGPDTRHGRKLLGVSVSSRSREAFGHTGSPTQVQTHLEKNYPVKRSLKARNKTPSATAPPVNQSTGTPGSVAQSVSTRRAAAPRRGTLGRWDTAAARPLHQGVTATLASNTLRPDAQCVRAGSYHVPDGGHISTGKKGRL